MTQLIHAMPTILASYMASLVECVEALTVVLAVGSVRGWHSALAGVAGALATLVVLVLLLGPSLTAIPIFALQIGIGLLLLLFGLRWLRKAILRAAGAIALHDEDAAFAKQAASLRSTARPGDRGFDPVAFGTAYKIVMLEGIEVVFIVIALGSGVGLLAPASIGAVAALVCVALLGLVLHRPLSKVPENSLKFVVGILLSAFGTFWVGEGIGIAWPGGDRSLPALILAYLIVGGTLALLFRRQRPPAAKTAHGAPAPRSWVARMSGELISMFIDDAWLAAGTTAWVAVNAFLVHRARLVSGWEAMGFAAGLAAILSLSGARGARIAARRPRGI